MYDAYIHRAYSQYEGEYVDECSAYIHKNNTKSKAARADYLPFVRGKALVAVLLFRYFWAVFISYFGALNTEHLFF